MRPGSYRGKLVWVHSASAGKFALFTVHARGGKDDMKAAGVLPHFRGITVHDAWAPYDPTWLKLVRTWIAVDAVAGVA